MRGTLTVELLSDTCFSQPATGDVLVDTEVAADGLGLPVVSGKTLRGLLRDTYGTARAAMDPSGTHEAALLGETQSNDPGAVFSLGDARLSETVRAWVRWAQEGRTGQSEQARRLPVTALSAAFLAERILTAEDRISGAPQTETLRAVRVIPKGTKLFAPFATARPLTPEEEALLRRLVQLTRHGGLHRNRGLGHVCLTLAWATDTEQDVPPELPAGVTGTIFVPVTLSLTAPCLIADRDIDANSRVTKPYLTGAAVRGAVAGALERAGVASDQIEEIVASGAVRFLNLYVASGPRRALPTPITFQREKNPVQDDAEAATRDLLVANSAGSDENGDEAEPTQWQPLRSAFLAGRQPVSVTTRARLHQQRDSATGGTGQGGGETVYVYEAIEPEQTFRGAVALPAERRDLYNAVIRALQPGTLLLGRSARAGYGGRPHISVGPPQSAEVVPAGRQPLRSGSLFLVCLTADAVLRDPRTGQHDPWQLRAALTGRFQGEAEVLDAAVAAGEARGYNRLWQTELPMIPCARMGSVALLRALQPLSPERLIQIQAEPLGERVAEGYGCFTILPATSGSPSLLAPAEPVAPEQPPTVEPPELIAAQRRLYRKRLRLLLTEAALDTADRLRVPSASLIQRLRVPLRDPDAWTPTWDTWLNASEENGGLRAKARNALRDAGLLGLLRQLLAADWAPRLNGEAEERERFQMASQTQTQAIWNEEKEKLRLYYVETLLARLARKAA